MYARVRPLLGEESLGHVTEHISFTGTNTIALKVNDSGPNEVSLLCLIEAVYLFYYKIKSILDFCHCVYLLRFVDHERTGQERNKT